MDSDILRIPALKHDSLSVQTNNAVAIRIFSVTDLTATIEVSEDDLHWRSLSDEVYQIQPYLDLPQAVLTYRYFRLETLALPVERTLGVKRSYCSFCRAALNFSRGVGTIQTVFAPKVQLFDVCSIDSDGYTATNEYGVAIAVAKYGDGNVDFLFNGIADLKESMYAWVRVGEPLYLSRLPGKITEKYFRGRQQLGISLGTKLMLFAPQL